MEITQRIKFYGELWPRLSYGSHMESIQAIANQNPNVKIKIQNPRTKTQNLKPVTKSSVAFLGCTFLFSLQIVFLSHAFFILCQISATSTNSGEGGT